MEKNSVLSRNDKSRLGRGLASLIPPQAPRPAEMSTPAGETSRVQELSLSSIVPNTFQPRTVFDPAALDELAASVAQHGVLQPVMVRPSGPGRYELIAGERRFRAAERAGLTRIPALIRETTDEESLVVALIENVQREDLNAVEAARGYRQLLDQFDLTQAELGQQIGKAQSTINHALHLLKLPAEMQESITHGQISSEHGKVLLSVTDKDAQRGLWQRMVDEGISVKQARVLAQGVASAGATSRRARPVPTKDVHWQRMEDRLRGALGLRVEVKPGRAGRGTLVVEFAGAEELEGLLERLA